jgi:hypothetical protein
MVMKTLGVTLLLLASCRSSSHSAESHQPVSNTPANTNQSEYKSTRESSQGALTAKEIQELLMTELGGLFRYDEKTVFPSYMVGDLNGDEVKDIIIIARLIEDGELNKISQLPFNLDKPLGAGVNSKQDVTTGELTLEDLKRYTNEPVVIILHGVPGNLWRTNQPQKRFVLLDAMHNDTKTMKLSRGRIKPAFAGDERKRVPPPSLKGDAILFIAPDDTGLAVYWDGQRYRWYPLKEVPKS